jgi:O-antigen/teichoic acid export membrane protein
MERAEAPAAASGARSGAVLGAASAASIVVNYVFLLAAGRVLGSAEYGSLAALLGLLAVVLIPASALQMAVSRDVSHRLASGDPLGADSLARTAVRWSVLATAPLIVVALALAAPFSDLFHIGSVGLVVLTELGLASALVLPAAMGVIQGYQRFHALAALFLLPVLLRLVLFGITYALGFRLGGAIFATTASALVSVLWAVGMVREPLARGTVISRQALVPFLRYLWPVAVGLIGIALLTHVDILVVKARLAAHDAGAYAAASAFARVGYFLPATILAVLFPRTAARQARGEQTEDILGRSLLATAVFCALLAVFYAATGVGLVTLTFGRSFAEGGRVLAPFALATGLFSIAYILVGYHLSRGETRYAWIVGAGVIAQLVLLSTVPSTLHGVVWTNLAVGAGLVVAHELFVESSVPALRAGLVRLSAGTRVRTRRLALEAGLVLLGAIAFVCALMHSVVAHLGSTIIGSPGSDSTGSVAWLWTLDHESGYHLLGITHHTLSGSPIGWNEGNGLNVQWLLPYYPAYLATKLFGAVAAYNLTTLAGYVLSGVTMYALARYLGCGRLVSAWAGIVFIVFPWHLARAEHGSLTHIEVLALLALALVAAARRPTWIRFGLVGLATLACWLTSGYYGGMAVVTAIAFSVGAALTLPRRRGLVLAAGSAGGALLASGLVAIAAYASGTNAGAGINRSSGDLFYYGLRPLELVVPSARTLVFGSGLDSFWARHAHHSNTTEISNYLGLLTFALAITWIVLVVRRRVSRSLAAATAGLATAFVVGFLFALPSPVGGVTMPSRLLWDLVPAFRVPSRWDPLLMTALLPLAALGLQSVFRFVAGRTRSVVAPALVVLAAICVSFVELATHTVHHFRTVPVPPEYQALRETPNGTLAEYPLGYSDIYRLWQGHHGRPLLNGAPAGSTADAARLVLLDPTQPGTAEDLSLLGVTAIGIHPGAHVDAEVAPGTPTSGRGYRLVGRFPDGSSIWDVVAPAAPALVTLPGGFLPPARSADGFYGFPFVASGGVAAMELRARQAATVRLSFDVQSPAGDGTHTLRVADEHAQRTFPVRGRTHVAVDVAVPRGVSQLLVKVDPAPTSAADAVALSPPRATATSGAAELEAQSLSPDPGF